MAEDLWQRRKKPKGRWTNLDGMPEDFDHETYGYRANGHREPPPPGPESVWTQIRLDDFPHAGYTTSVEIHNTADGPRVTFIGVGMSPTPLDDHDTEFPYYSEVGSLRRDSNSGDILNASGVTARLLKDLNHTAIVKAALQKLNAEDPYGLPTVDEAIRQITAGLGRSRTQRRDDPFKARLAAAYVAQVAETGGRGVYTEMAAKLNYSESTLRSYVQELRSSGFLSPGRAGAAGGELTDKSKQILEATGGNDGKRPT